MGGGAFGAKAGYGKLLGGGHGGHAPGVYRLENFGAGGGSQTAAEGMDKADRARIVFASRRAGWLFASLVAAICLADDQIADALA